MTRPRAFKRMSVPLTLLLLIATACAASEQTSTPDTTASASATASVAPTPIEATATAEPTPLPTPAPPASSTATFSLLAIDPPAGDPSQITCSGDIGPSDPVAVVSLKGTRRVAGLTVMRDYIDPANPRTVCEFRSTEITQLIDARHVVIESCDGAGCALAVVDLPEVRYHWFALPTDDDTSGNFIAVSPGLDEVAWSSTDTADNYARQNRRLHLTRADGDHVVARFLPVGGRCGSGDDSKLGAYSRSGAHMYALDVPIAGQTVFVGLHGLDQVFMFRPPGGNWPDATYPAMPLWSVTDEVLYYRRDGSVWSWTPTDGEQLFLDGVGWQFPTMSPDGRYLAYVVPQDDGSHDAFLIDLQEGGAPELIGEQRTMPVFLTATQLWFKSESGSGCVTQQEDELIYDVNESAESRSIIDWVRAVWPATSSNA